jgi:hypothetical protein
MTTEQTLGERIDQFYAIQERKKFPPGTKTHHEATQLLEDMRPGLRVHMVSMGIVKARTKVAVAELDEYGWLTVEHYEVAF